MIGENVNAEKCTTVFCGKDLWMERYISEATVSELSDFVSPLKGSIQLGFVNGQKLYNGIHMRCGGYREEIQEYRCGAAATDVHEMFTNFGLSSVLDTSELNCKRYITDDD